jgi:resuscitation-promoting factor RpfE
VHTLKKLGLAAVCLALSLALLAGVGSGPVAAEGGDPATTTATTPPAPSTTTTAPAAEEPSTTTTAPPAAQPAPSSSTASEDEPRIWGPDPRWIDYGNCGPGVTACHVAKAHQNRGLYQWRNGRWFVWGERWVRGTPGETWTSFRQEARQIRLYLYLVAVAAYRYSLVANWSGVANCETGGNWSASTGNGYYGGLQFSLGTWQAYGGAGMPNQQPAWYQAQIADRVRVQSGLGHWPGCGQYYG